MGWGWDGALSFFSVFVFLFFFLVLGCWTTVVVPSRFSDDSRRFAVLVLPALSPHFFFFSLSFELRTYKTQSPNVVGRRHIDESFLSASY